MTYYQFYQQHLGLYPVDMGIIVAASAHAQSSYPEECVGIVAGDTYHPLSNIHENPLEHFDVDPRQVKAITDRFGAVQAVIHSHPDGEAAPSEHDMRQQIAWNVPWGIIAVTMGRIVDIAFFGDSVKRAPYEGRPFKHGIYDCYGLARDWYRGELGIVLPDVPRRDHWWVGSDRDNLLEGQFRDVGFVEIDMFELRRGDAIMGRLLNFDAVNHCAVYLGNELILHHLYGDVDHPRLSRVEPLHSWKRYITHCLRHHSQVQTSASGD